MARDSNSFAITAEGELRSGPSLAGSRGASVALATEG